MINNRSSISHSIRAEGYKYDVLKGEFTKGSSISKAVHPIPEVEEFKKNLLARKILKDMRTHWELKKNLRTGHLMALNLHFGTLMTESPFKQDIIVTSEEAEELDGKLPEKHICVTDSEIVMKSIRDTLRLSSINIMEVDEEVFINHSSDFFGRDESFVLKILQEKGIISAYVRHGLTKENEADIVDEINGEQYEVTYEFKTDLPKKSRKPDTFYSPEILAMQLVDSPFIHTSHSLGRKLKKEYTDKYRPNLVILTLGTKDSTISMLEALGEKLKRDQITKLNYTNIYILVLNFVDEQAILARISATEPFTSETFPCKNEELGFIKLTPVQFSEIENTQKYLIVCDGIFDNTHRMRYDDGSTLRTWAKDLRIWGV